MTHEQLSLVREWGENLAHCRQPEISAAISAVMARLDALEKREGQFWDTY